MSAAYEFPEITPSAKLPAVLAVIGVNDHGPMDGGYGSAQCPHCGAEGRYVLRFICEDGKVHAAMRGCFQLFPSSNSPISRLVTEAFKRDQQAREAKPPRKLASWWSAMIAACDRLEASGGGHENVQAFIDAINAAERTRQAWLNRNGYGRFRRRR